MESVDYEAKLGSIQVGLRKDLVVTRQDTRGDASYVIHDPVTFRNHVFSIDEYRVLTAIVAERSLADTFAYLVQEGALEVDEKDDFYTLVLSLHGMTLLQLPISQADILFKRYMSKRAAKSAAWHQAFMYLKIPLLNPDRFLRRTLKYVGWVFTRYGIAMWAALMACVIWKCFGRLDEMFAQTAGLLQIGNLPVLWIALVGLKVIHEFGHAYACRKLGGAVPEMGVAMIVMTPCAYVDASSSWKFDSRWQRIGVTLAGMYVESIVAGIAALVWVSTAPGFVHDVALNVIALATVVTVFLNINPLMKFDGYFAFSDAMRVVNLQERAFRFLKGWAGYFALGLPRPHDDYPRSERRLYAMYAPSAFVYRFMLAFGITSLIVMQWPGGAVFLGAIFVWLLMIVPTKRLFDYLLKSEDTAPVRSRARLLSMAMVLLVPLALVFLPISSSVHAPGILDPGVRRSVRAPMNGFVSAVLTTNGADVDVGAPLVVLTNPDLEMRRLEMVGEMLAEEVRLDTSELENPALASTHRARLKFLRARVAEIERRLASMSVSAGITGTVVSGERIDWLGRYVRQGDELFQVHSDHRFLRIVLSDQDVARARLEIGSEAEIRWASAPYETVRGVVREIRRSASRNDVPIELTMLAGGELYARPTGNNTTVTDQPYLHVFLEADSVPFDTGGDGLTARIRIAAQVQTLGGWVKRKMLGFFYAWKMS